MRSSGDFYPIVPAVFAEAAASEGFLDVFFYVRQPATDVFVLTPSSAVLQTKRDAKLEIKRTAKYGADWPQAFNKLPGDLVGGVRQKSLKIGYIKRTALKTRVNPVYGLGGEIVQQRPGHNDNYGLNDTTGDGGTGCLAGYISGYIINSAAVSRYRLYATGCSCRFGFSFSGRNAGYAFRYAGMRLRRESK